LFRSLVGSLIGARIRIRPVSTLDMSSGAFRDEHQSQAVARTPTPFPCKSIGAEYHLHEPTVSFHIREIGYTAIVFYRLTCSSQAHHHRLQLCRTTSVSRLPAAGTELAVKPKGQGCSGTTTPLLHGADIDYYCTAAKSSHTFSPLLSHSSCWPGVREISLPRHWSAASAMHEQKAYD
jgi:hypothetical protein